MENTDYSKILQFYDRVVALNEFEKKDLISKLEVFRFKKKSLIVKEGTIGNYVYFVNKGVLRSYYLKDGDEVTTQFYLPNSYCASYSSFLNQEKGRLNIDCLTEVELLGLSYKNVQYLYDKYSSLNTFGRRVSERLYIDFYKRFSSFLLDDAKTRYLTLLKERPEVLKHVPNYMVASYIGITPESLSRLKKSLVLR